MARSNATPENVSKISLRQEARLLYLVEPSRMAYTTFGRRMSTGRIITLTLFAAFFGLFFVGVVRFRSVALLFYAAMFVHLAINYRKIKGVDEKSVAFQREVEARNKQMPWTCSNKDYAKILMAGMCCSLLLAIIALLGK